MILEETKYLHMHIPESPITHILHTTFSKSSQATSIEELYHFEYR